MSVLSTIVVGLLVNYLSDKTHTLGNWIKSKKCNKDFCNRISILLQLNLA